MVDIHQSTHVLIHPNDRMPEPKIRIQTTFPIIGIRERHYPNLQYLATAALSTTCSSACAIVWALDSIWTRLVATFLDGRHGRDMAHLLANDADLVLTAVELLVLAFPLLRAEGVLRLGHDDRSQAVAHNVGERAEHVHDPVDAEDQRHRPRRNVKLVQGRRHHDDGGGAHTGHTLGGHHEHEHHDDLLTDRLVHASGLGTEDRTQRQIQRRAVQVERVAEGHHEARNVRRHAVLLEGLEHLRQSGLRCGRRTHCTEDNDDEEDNGHVDGGDESSQTAQSRQTVRGDRIGNGETHTDGGRPDDDVHELEHHLEHGARELEDEVLVVLVQHRRGNAREDRGHQDLQQLGRALTAHHLAPRLGRQVLDPRFEREGGRGAVVVVALGQPDLAGLDDVDGEEAQDQRQRRDHLEVDDGLEREAPKLLHVLLVGDAHHERREHEWEHDELDWAQEDVLHGGGLLREGGGELTENDSDDHADDDPEGQRREHLALPRLLRWDGWVHGLVVVVVYGHCWLAAGDLRPGWRIEE
ncbi:hypothetical protein ON010_g13833 [Phytophthora cinnamomi]|nr:hypothetical protein ON010_g13833 [Phytophthora cinnamomi]